MKNFKNNFHQSFNLLNFSRSLFPISVNRLHGLSTPFQLYEPSSRILFPLYTDNSFVSVIFLKIFVLERIHDNVDQYFAESARFLGSRRRVNIYASI